MIMNYKVKLKNIKAFIFDYDGVLSDGNIYTVNKDMMFRSGNVKDGYAIQYAIKKGYKVAVLSGGSGQSISARMEMLGVKDVFLSASNKLEVYKQYLKDNNLVNDDVLYMGDDIPDYDIMQSAAVACCPSDAAYEIKQAADYVSDKCGGCGCVRDVIEQVLRLQNQWFNEDSKAW